MIARSARCAPLVAIVAVLFGAMAVAIVGAGARTAAAAPVDTTVPVDAAAPPVTDNEFFPESAELTDCVGVLERPGCGSESRGGWRQTLVFVVMGAGLVLVFARVAIGVRRARRRDPAEPQPPVAG
jgi:hypothetical protein